MSQEPKPELEIFLIRSYFDSQKDKATRPLKRVRLFWKPFRKLTITNKREAGNLEFDCRQTLRIVGHTFAEGTQISSNARFRGCLSSIMFASFRDSNTKIQDVSYTWKLTKRKKDEKYYALLLKYIQESRGSNPPEFANEFSILGGAAFEPPLTRIELDETNESILHESLVELEMADMISLDDGFQLSYKNGDRLLSFQFTTYKGRQTLHLVKTGSNFVPVPSSNPEHILLHLLAGSNVLKLLPSHIKPTLESALVEYLKGLESGLKIIAASLLSPLLCDAEEYTYTPELLQRMLEVLKAKATWWSLLSKHMFEPIINTVAENLETGTNSTGERHHSMETVDRTRHVFKMLQEELVYLSELNLLEKDLALMLGDRGCSGSVPSTDLSSRDCADEGRAGQPHLSRAARQEPQSETLGGDAPPEDHLVVKTTQKAEGKNSLLTNGQSRNSGLGDIIKRFKSLILRPSPDRLFEISNICKQSDPWMEAYKGYVSSKMKALVPSAISQPEYTRLPKLCALLQEMNELVRSGLHLADTTFVTRIDSEKSSQPQKPEDLHSLTPLVGRELVMPTMDRCSLDHRFVANYGGQIFIIVKGSKDHPFSIITQTGEQNQLTTVSNYPNAEISSENSRFIYHNGRILEAYSSNAKLLLVNLRGYFTTAKKITYGTGIIKPQAPASDSNTKIPDLLLALGEKYIHILRFENAGSEIPESEDVRLLSYSILPDGQLGNGQSVDMIEVLKTQNSQSKGNLGYTVHNCCFWTFETHKVCLIGWIYACRKKYSKQIGWILKVNFAQLNENGEPSPHFRLADVMFPDVTPTPNKLDQPSNPVVFTHCKHILLLMISPKLKIKLVALFGHLFQQVSKLSICPKLLKMLSPSSGFSPVASFPGQIQARDTLLRVDRRRPHVSHSHSTYRVGRIALKLL